MKYRFLALPILSVLLLGYPLAIQGQDAGGPPLGRRGGAMKLRGDGKPYLILGAEIHNSSSSSLDYMEPEWPRLAAMGLNTVLTPVSWELIDPVQGKFDFTLW